MGGQGSGDREEEAVRQCQRCRSYAINPDSHGRQEGEEARTEEDKRWADLQVLKGMIASMSVQTSSESPEGEIVYGQDMLDLLTAYREKHTSGGVKMTRE